MEHRALQGLVFPLSLFLVSDLFPYTKELRVMSSNRYDLCSNLSDCAKIGSFKSNSGGLYTAANKDEKIRVGYQCFPPVFNTRLVLV
jgi:hypothetical protein